MCIYLRPTKPKKIVSYKVCYLTERKAGPQILTSVGGVGGRVCRWIQVCLVAVQRIRCSADPTGSKQMFTVFSSARLDNCVLILQLTL